MDSARVGLTPNSSVISLPASVVGANRIISNQNFNQ